MAMSYDELKNKVLTRYGNIDAIPDSVYHAMRSYKEKGVNALDDDRTYNILVAERDYSPTSNKFNIPTPIQGFDPSKGLSENMDINQKAAEEAVAGINPWDMTKQILSAPGKGVAYALGGKGLTEEQRQEHPTLASTYEVAKNIATSPYNIPLAFVGGPIISGMGKLGTGLLGSLATPTVRAAGALAAEGTLNAGVGMFDRATSSNENLRAFDVGNIARDFALGAALPGGLKAIGAAGRGLTSAGKTKFANAVVDNIAPSDLTRVHGAFSGDLTGKATAGKSQSEIRDEVSEAIQDQLFKGKNIFGIGSEVAENIPKTLPKTLPTSEKILGIKPEASDIVISPTKISGLAAGTSSIARGKLTPERSQRPAEVIGEVVPPAIKAKQESPITPADLEANQQAQLLLSKLPIPGAAVAPLARQLGRSEAMIGAGRALASLGTEPKVMVARALASNASTIDQDQRKLDSLGRSITETEYNALKYLIRKKSTNLTDEEKSYLQHYGFSR